MNEFIEGELFGKNVEINPPYDHALLSYNADRLKTHIMDKAVWR